MANVTEVADGIHRFDASGANVYVVVTDEGLTVVDAGLPGWWGPFSTWLHRSGRTPHEIVALLMTHRHADHIGFADRAHDHGADLLIHEDDLAGVQRSGPGGVPPRFSRNLWRPQMIARMVDWGRRGVTNTPALTDVRTCTDREQLDVPGRPRVIHMPGHTPGSAAFVFDDHGVVCTGDALITRDIATGAKGIGISPTGMNDDDDEALASLDRLEGVDAILLPGHGEPYRHGITSALHAARAIGADW
jgi:glyoxylase-like metal-dependent hydrolase (beta-lactamase superfamily II)